MTRSCPPDNGRVAVIRDCRIVNSSEGDGDLNHVVIRLTRRPPDNGRVEHAEEGGG